MKISFMTEYFQSLHLDTETISRLKEDKPPRKKFIRTRAREYMDEVRKLKKWVGPL